MPEKIGEIIEASTTEFTAQCYELHQPPAFGSLVKTREGDVEIYGVVCGAETTSIEPGQRLIARGLRRLGRGKHIGQTRSWPGRCGVKRGVEG